MGGIVKSQVRFHRNIHDDYEFDDRSANKSHHLEKPAVYSGYSVNYLILQFSPKNQNILAIFPFVFNFIH